MSLRKFQFNTGVKIWDNPTIKGGFDSGNGTVVVPFYCDVPENAKFMFASNFSDLDKWDSQVIKAEIKNSGLISKYAYFKLIPKNFKN